MPFLYFSLNIFSDYLVRVCVSCISDQSIISMSRNYHEILIMCYSELMYPPDVFLPESIEISL